MLERLHGSLLDYLVAAAGAPASERLSALRKIAHQLLVRRPMLDLCFYLEWGACHILHAESTCSSGARSRASCWCGLDHRKVQPLAHRRASAAG